MRLPGTLALCLVLPLLAAKVIAADGPFAPGLPMPPGGDTLRIRGVPPLQLPPGTRVFGPNGPVDPESLGPARPRGEAPRATPRETEVTPEPAKPGAPKFKPRPVVREATQRAKI